MKSIFGDGADILGAAKEKLKPYGMEIPDLGTSSFGLDHLLLTPEERSKKLKEAGAAAQSVIGAPPLASIVETLFPRAHRNSA